MSSDTSALRIAGTSPVMISNNKALIFLNTKASNKTETRKVERLNSFAPYPYAGMIRIRFKGSVRLDLLPDISGHLAAPQAFPSGMYGHSNVTRAGMSH